MYNLMYMKMNLICWISVLQLRGGREAGRLSMEFWGEWSFTYRRSVTLLFVKQDSQQNIILKNFSLQYIYRGFCVFVCVRMITRGSSRLARRWWASTTLWPSRRLTTPRSHMSSVCRQRTGGFSSSRPRKSQCWVCLCVCFRVGRSVSLCVFLSDPKWTWTPGSAASTWSRLSTPRLRSPPPSALRGGSSDRSCPPRSLLTLWYTLILLFL